MITLYELIESTQKKLEGIKVPGTVYCLADYTHGRCHLFAQALQEECGYEMEFLWDEEYWFDDADEPLVVLVHAYCIVPNSNDDKEEYVDARGSVSKLIIEREYECVSLLYDKSTLQQLKIEIEQGNFSEPEENEISSLRSFIKENKSLYYQPSL